MAGFHIFSTKLYSFTKILNLSLAGVEHGSNTPHRLGAKDLQPLKPPMSSNNLLLQRSTNLSYTHVMQHNITHNNIIFKLKKKLKCFNTK